MIDNIAEIDRLERLLHQHMGRRFRELRLTLRGHGVALQGQCGTQYAKQLAQHAVIGATMLPLVANEIQVCGNGRHTNG